MPTTASNLTCSLECRRERTLTVAREHDKRKREERKQKNKKKTMLPPLVDVAVKAREAGMTYGQYVAKTEGQRICRIQRKN